MVNHKWIYYKLHLFVEGSWGNMWLVEAGCSATFIMVNGSRELGPEALRCLLVMLSHATSHSVAGHGTLQGSLAWLVVKHAFDFTGWLSSQPANRYGAIWVTIEEHGG